MNYSVIWKKVLNQGEKPLYEFTISGVYRWLALIVSNVSVLAIALVIGIAAGWEYYIIAGLVVVVGSGITFYYLYYLPAANAYCLTNKRLVVHTGWLHSNTISIDYKQITDIRVNQGLLQKYLVGDGYLIVNTAGTAGYEAVLRRVPNPYTIKKKINHLRQSKQKSKGE